VGFVGTVDGAAADGLVREFTGVSGGVEVALCGAVVGVVPAWGMTAVVVVTET